MLVVAAPLVVVVAGDVVVVVVDEGQWNVRSQACPEQQTVVALHGSPSSVQQSQPEGLDWQCSNWTGQAPMPQLVLFVHTIPGFWHEHLFPLGEFMRHVCPAGQLPPHIPAPDPPEPATNPHGIVVVVVVAVATVVVVVDVLVVAAPLVLVVDGDVVVVVVDEGQWNVRSHACPEQQTVAALHGLPSIVQQSQAPEGGVGWQCSYWTGQAPMPQLVLFVHTIPGFWHEHLLPLGEFMRHVCPGGQLPPHIPAADPPEPATNPHGIVVVVVVAVTTVVVEPPAMVVVVVAVVVVVVAHTAIPRAALPDWNAARSGASSTASTASMFSASWLARPVQVSAETWVWQSTEPASVTEQSSPCPWSAESAAAPPRPSARTG